MTHVPRRRFNAGASHGLETESTEFQVNAVFTGRFHELGTAFLGGLDPDERQARSPTIACSDTSRYWKAELFFWEANAALHMILKRGRPIQFIV